ncbi:MAG: nucleotide exchange factor GrpE [Patescibacteria group bacterium]|nr:nucleotide exchange factor GrpE [Patescibacteria group bacterium]
MKKQENDDITFVESNEDGEELTKKDRTKKLREDLKVCRKEKEEYLTGWQRAKADYINLQKELDSIRVNSILTTKEKIVENILPVLDSFDMALKDKGSDKGWRKGIDNVYQQLMESLKNSDVEKIDQINVEFNPNIHQSIGNIKTKNKKKDHFVAEIMQVGYKIGDRVIRPAMVKIFS